MTSIASNESPRTRPALKPQLYFTVATLALLPLAIYLSFDELITLLIGLVAIALLVLPIPYIFIRATSSVTSTQNPFQISLGRVLAMVALLGVTVRLLELYLTSRYEPGMASEFYLLGCFTAGGATAGLGAGRPIRGACIGFLIGLVGCLFSVFGPSDGYVRE